MTSKSNRTGNVKQIFYYGIDLKHECSDSLNTSESWKLNLKGQEFENGRIMFYSGNVFTKRSRISNQIQINEIESKSNRIWQYQTMFQYGNDDSKNIQNHQPNQKKIEGITNQ
jgi:hypothetical protein